MSKTRRKRAKREEHVESQGTQGSLMARVAEVVAEGQQALRELVLSAGFEVFAELLEEDRRRLCGPRYARPQERRAYRHGHGQGVVVLGGRQVRLRKPRVRSVSGEELSLASWETMKDQDPLQERAVEQILCGVSTRKYERSLEELPDEKASVGTSKSSVSRRFIARTRRQVEAFLSRPLGELDLPVLMLDGTEVGRHLLIVALGIDRQGSKHVLGVIEGSSESTEVCRQLLRGLLERGLVVERHRLVVIDGSKGLHKAVRVTFGSWAVIQRCRVHKMRNVLEHLPKRLRPWFQTKIRKAWDLPSVESAERELRALADALDEDHPGAAASLREGLDETLTVNRLGLAGALLKTLRSTNPIENVYGSVKTTARNVKRWRSGSMALRWVVTALAEAELRFRRIRGFRDLDQLEVGLTRLLEDQLDNEALGA